MPTVIDSLLVTLGLDPKKFSTGTAAAQKKLVLFQKTVKQLGVDESVLDAQQRKAYLSLARIAIQSQAARKELSAAGAVAKEFWGVMEGGMLAFGGAVGVYGLSRMVSQTVSSVGDLARAAPLMGMGVKALSQWTNAVREVTGADGAATGGAFRSLSDMLTGIRSGKTPNDLIQALGLLSHASKMPAISVLGANGQAKTADELLKEMADQVKSAGPQQSAAILDGLLPDELITLLGAGRGGVEDALKKAEPNAVSPKDAEDIKRLEATTNELTDAFTKLKTVVLPLVAPFASSVMKNTAAWLQYQHGDITKSQYDEIIRKNYSDEFGEDSLAQKDAERALSTYKEKHHILGRGISRYVYPTPKDATPWTDKDRIARLKQLLADKETVQSAIEILGQEEAAGRAPGAQVGVTPLGQTPSGVASGAVSDKLLDRLKQVESSGKAGAISSAGALGPYQFEPGTAKEFGVKDPFNEQDARAGARLALTYYYQKYKGNMRKALAAYNAGEQAIDEDIAVNGDNWDHVRRSGNNHGLPDETAAYLAKFSDFTGDTTTTTIHQNGPITINVASGNPNTIASGLHSAIVNNANSGPH